MSAQKKRMDFGAVAARQLQRNLDAAASGPDRFERAQAAMAGPPSALDVDSIVGRQQATRETDQGHVQALAESIAALGLIEPIVVDMSHRLLAGGHRLEAIKLLRRDNNAAFAKWFSGGVPVRILDFDADVSPSRALEIEVAENEHRRDYTTSQVKELVTRLKDAGYRDTVGRPRAGEKALGPALEVIVGKSMKTIRKLLCEQEGGRAAPRPLPNNVAVLLRMLVRYRNSLPDHCATHCEALITGLQAELRGRELDDP